MSDLNMRIAQYVKLRDEIKRRDDEHKEAMKPYRETLDQLNTWLLGELAKQGSESVRTESGTVYRTDRVSASIADTTAFWDFVRDNEQWDLLDRRANKTAVTDYVHENGAPPPGINYTVSHVVGVRRS